MTGKKIRFNSLDVFIILLVISAIAISICLFFPQIKHITASDTNVTYHIDLNNCDINVANAFKEAYEKGETLKVGEHEFSNATILSCEIVPVTEILINDHTKEIKTVEKADCYTVKLKLHTEAKDTGEEILFGNMPIRVGTNITVKCQKTAKKDSIIQILTD